MLNAIVQYVRFKIQLRKFKRYLEFSLCPGYLEERWNYESHISAEHAFRILQSDLYPKSHKCMADRWREFANFLFIYAVGSERECGIEMPLHSNELAEYAITHLDALCDPEYEKNILFKTLSPEYHDIYVSFFDRTVAAKVYLPKS